MQDGNGFDRVALLNSIPTFRDSTEVSLVWKSKSHDMSKRFAH